jgi:hypothetical protein
MTKTFLDSSVVIGLLFRHAGERKACELAIPAGQRVCSRYVVYEIARGFLLNLIDLHNHSFDYDCYSDLHQASHSGQIRFKRYKMHTWLGAFDDFEAALEMDDVSSKPSEKLLLFRAKLSGWIKRGWVHLESQFEIINPVGCRLTLSAPFVRDDHFIEHRLPLNECGNPTACGVQTFFNNNLATVEKLVSDLEALSGADKDEETIKRIEALKHLSCVPKSEAFDGKKCHRCGDAIICMEAPSGYAIATKNKKHFEPLARSLGKEHSLVIAESAKSTRA